MINYYKTVDGRIHEIENAEKGAWVSVVSPSPEEIKFLAEVLEVDEDFIKSSLDEDETSHIEKEGDQTLIIIDVPVQDDSPQDESTLYSTMALGFVIKQNYFLTISSKEMPVLDKMLSGLVKNINTAYKTNFILTVFLHIAMRYIQFLHNVDKISNETEKRLHKSMRNEELIKLLSLQKSLVYFSTGLKSTEITLEKILRGRIIKLYDEDEELLEDALIEFKQAIETCNIYTNILSGTMDAFASIISNNLNIVMEGLTSITIIMAIPNIIFGFYGMNVDLPWDNNIIMPLFLTLLICTVVFRVLFKRGNLRLW